MPAQGGEGGMKGRMVASTVKETQHYVKESSLEGGHEQESFCLLALEPGEGSGV